MMTDAINLAEKFAKFSDPWSPRIIARLNDLHLKAVKATGEFVWHSHPETDEMFLVTKGSLVIKLRDRDVPLKTGELFVVPKGVEHKPVADGVCEVLLLEPAGTINTGDAGGARTARDEPWI